jgi:hypothetical protein
MLRAIGRGVNVNMLIIKVGCANARHRGVELEPGFPWSGYVEKHKAFRDDCLSEARKATAPGRLEMIEYSDLPSAPIYLVVRNGKPIIGYSSNFLGTPTGSGFPHFRWLPSRVNMLQEMYDYVERKWNRNLEWSGPMI